MSDSKWVVVGITQWGEDGFELVRVCDSEEEAEEFIDSGGAERDSERSWDQFYATEVSYDV